VYIVLIFRIYVVKCHFPSCQMYPAKKAPPLAITTSSRPILILPAYLHVGFPRSLFPSDVPTKQCTNLSPMHATCHNPSHPPSIDHPNNICKQYKSQISSHDCLHYPPTSSLLSPNTFGYATMNTDATTNAEDYYRPT